MEDPYLDTPVITRRELKAIIEETVLQTLERIGAISPNMKRQDAIKIMGRANFERGVLLGLLNPIKKGGRTSTVEVPRVEIEEYLQTNVLHDGTEKPIIYKKK